VADLITTCLGGRFRPASFHPTSLQSHSTPTSLRPGISRVVLSDCWTPFACRREGSSRALFRPSNGTPNACSLDSQQALRRTC
jgi:hypothetical protein